MDSCALALVSHPKKQRLGMFSKMKKPCSGFEPCEQLCLLTE